MAGTKIAEVMQRFNSSAVIFDLDGTLLDNNPFHLKSWKQYLKQIGRELSDDEYNANINGRTNRDVVTYLYGNDITDEELWKYTLEKEAVYRELYKPFIRPVEGLPELLDELYKREVPMAIATSGIKVNIDFMFENVPIRKYFREVVDSSYISRGKPDPEIFLVTASRLNIPPAACLVFEDSLVGIESARAAGMRVVAVATTHPAEELAPADMIIRDYTELL